LNQFVRTQLLFGEKNMELLKNSSIIIFGIGGVGSYVAEALARCGVFNLTFVDNDEICQSNLNRQICANINTIGQLKTKVMKRRILEINPAANITTINEFVNEKNVFAILNKNFTYVVDAIDTITSKIQIIIAAQNLKLPIISCMGTGNKINPLLLDLTDIYKTKYCPLAKIMRRELKKRGVKKLRVCYSIEQPKKITQKEKIISSTPFVPATAGLIIASDIVKNIINDI
jgi:Dinucleotide-utilizing enzymes involved in molybdopterin and thiamine biosynthesis family 1